MSVTRGQPSIIKTSRSQILELPCGWAANSLEQALYEPRHEKTFLRGLRPGKTQTGLLSWWDLARVLTFRP